MPIRYFNWKLAVVLVIGVIVLGATAFGLRQWQRTTRASQGLTLGNKAYEEENWQEAAQQLGRYLAVVQDDVPALLKYADAHLNIRPLKRNNLQQAVAAYRTVLRVEEDNAEACTKLTGLYLGMGMAGEAELIAKRYLEANENLELRRMLAMALASQRKFNEAATELKAIIAEHPEQVLAYDALARLAEQRPTDFADPPDRWYDEAIKNNQSSALAYIARAGFYLRSRDNVRASGDLEKAEKLDLSDSSVRLRLANELINADSLDKAEQHLAGVREADPTAEALWQTWAQLALRSSSKEKMLQVAEDGLRELSSRPWDFMPLAVELFIRGGELGRANECISQMHQKDIAPAQVAFLRGLVAVDQNQPREAVRYWRQSIELGNKSTQVRLALASTLSALGEPQGALQHLRALTSEKPDSVEGHLALARQTARIGDWPQTEEYARKVLGMAPGNAQATLLLLQARIQQLAASEAGTKPRMWDDIERQLSELDRATEGAVEVRFIQLQVAMLRGDFARAETLVGQLKKDHGEQVRTAMVEAEVLAAQQKEADAILLLNKAVERFPQAAEPVKYLAVLLARQNDNEQCEAVIKDALGRIEQPAAQRELGLILAGFYARWQRSDEVYPMLKTLAEKLPEDIPIKSRLLRCESVMKDPAEAQRLIEEIKSIEGEEGQQWRYEQARAWFGAEDFKGRYPQVVSLLQENLLTNPDDQASRILLAVAQEKAADLRTALSTYRQALNRSPQDVRVIVLTVAALYKAGESDEAEAILERASKQDLYHPQLQRLQLHSHLVRGQLDSAADILQDFLVTDPNDSSAMLALAQLKIGQKKLSEAAELLDTLSVREPNSLLVTRTRVQLNIELERPEDAIKLCDEAVQKLNNASAYVLRARAYNMLEQPEKAAEDLARAVAIEPDSTTVWLARSEFYGSTGQLDKAAEDVRHALSLDPNNVQIQRRLISLFLTSGDSQKITEAKGMLEKALASYPDESGLLLIKARSLLAEGTTPAIDNAQRILEKLTENEPKVSEAWVLLGEVFFRQRQSARALDVALRGLVHRSDDKALLILKARAEAMRSPILAIPTLKVLRDQDPNDVDIAVLLAEMYAATGNPGTAVSLLRKQLSVCDASTRRKCNLALAVALYQNDEKTDAQREFDLLESSQPEDPNLLLVQTRLLRGERLWDELKRKVSDWCENNPRETAAPVQVAAELMETNDDEARKTSEEVLQTILANHADCAEAMTVLGILMQTTGRYQEAVGLYRKILTLKPDDTIAMNNLAWILCEEQGKYREALDLTEKALKTAPNYIDLIDTRGVVRYRLGEFDEAIKDFTACLKLYPRGAPAATATYFHLGRALAEDGQKDRATEQLRRALELNTQMGGLSQADLAETKRLLEELSRRG